ncbi:hypothetical protein HYPSUDRAFT_934050 [Hypholoma sublateritium FD-334 SS-4]|uniref:Uncharacterized protein n=1 Tax=Hypholoma sublateritium (strain FD-334 SS-4) TaxID=945553 RepID=A0A0D2P8W9_HYPSF|nr:hypothetical protein HYPSUDRAFT_934050 [Hypholoma sublateritium FD-334 SS-4]
MADSDMIYDDTDPAFIYQPTNGDWFAGTWNASSVGQSGTLHTTNDLTANVTFTFPVAAIGFSYFGIQRSHGGLYGICIDCTPGAPNFITVDAFNATDNGANPPVSLYNQTFSTPGVHQIIIQNMADPRGTPAGNSQLTIDRIELFVPSSTPGTTTVFIPSSAVTSGAATTTGSSASEGTGRSGSSNSSSPPVGAIVGGILGGLALLIGVLVFVYWRRLRRAHAREEELGVRSEPYDDPSVSRISQFRAAPPVSIPPATSSTVSPWGGYGLSVSTLNEKAAAAARNNHQRMMPSITSIATSTQPSSSASVTASGSGSGSGSITSPAIVPMPGLPRRERDAGPLPVPVEDEEDEEDTLPPEYGQVFAREPSTRRNRRTMPRIPDAVPPARIEEKDSMTNHTGNEGTVP